jgi:hypothetical protein
VSKQEHVRALDATNLKIKRLTNLRANIRIKLERNKQSAIGCNFSDNVLIILNSNSEFTKWVYYLFIESGEFYLGDKFLSATSCYCFLRNFDLNYFLQQIF